MTNEATSGFLRVVDHAAAMNDRWLFLAAIAPQNETALKLVFCIDRNTCVCLGVGSVW